MVSLTTGGGSSAVAASSHASCERFRYTDPMLTGKSRRQVAEICGNPDTSAGIPEARWMRAMTLERLVRDSRFISELLTTAIGRLDFDRPSEVHAIDAHVNVEETGAALNEAHQLALRDDIATIITSMAVPFVGLEAEPSATPVKPDFAIVCPRKDDEGQPIGSWLIMGDVKDYERVRSRIDDARMMKGFLQVALGAESAAVWSLLPDGMDVHSWGALAVPKNAFLQPEAVVECLDDHRAEVRTRAAERHEASRTATALDLRDRAVRRHVEHLRADFDPVRCTTCSLFNHCRNELRAMGTDEALLVEIGVRPEYRPSLLEYLSTGEVTRGIPESVTARLRATLSGAASLTGQRRVDPVSRQGTVELVLAKSDAATLGVHGMAVRRVDRDGRYTRWEQTLFDDPQSSKTRHAVMKHLGEPLKAALKDQETLGSDVPGPVHLVVPDGATADLLVSIADSLGGIEISRLRWERDVAMGREPLTFNGERASMPPALSKSARAAVSFLLEADRSRAMVLRDPIIDLRGVVASHVLAGGPAGESGRLDYLVEWAEHSSGLDHRAISDQIAGRLHTPGARLSNARSDAIHEALKKSKLSSSGSDRYEKLVKKELQYKQEILERAVKVLQGFPLSKLAQVYVVLETDAQTVWRRRMALHASDLVRFGRTSEFWRDRQREILDGDQTCALQLEVLTNPQVAMDLAQAAGTREVALATVVSVNPLRLAVESRRIAVGDEIVMLVINGEPLIEVPQVTLKVQKGSFKFGQMCVGLLSEDPLTLADGALTWSPALAPSLHVGDQVIVACGMYKTFASGHEIAVDRPKIDDQSSPTETCDANSYASDPESHKYCCRPHEVAEADTADWMAERRVRGEANPETWPPLRDGDQFDVLPKKVKAKSLVPDVPDTPDPGLTMDDLD